MREFTPSEEEILTRLRAVSGSLIRLQSFLEQVFFSEQHGRALILQPAGRFGYFYLKPSVYDDERSRARELTRLIELMMLMVYLRDQGVAIVNAGPPESRLLMQFVGAAFRNPKPGTRHIVLNERGDYTFDPTTICDQADKVIYKGLRLEGDLYDLVAGVSGLLYVSPALKTLIPPPPPEPEPEPAPAPAPAPSRFRALRWWPVHVVAAMAAAWIVYRGVPDQWFANAAPQRSSATAPASAGVEAGRDWTTPPAQPAAVPAAVQEPLPAAPAPALPVVERTEHYGVDLSRWNAGVIESALDSNRLDFVFVRATYGQGTDVDFQRNWNLLRERSIIRGAYHFYLVHDDPIEQIEHYLSVVGDSEELEMPPAVDFEELSFPPRATPPDVATVQSALLNALAHIEARTRRLPILYTNVSIGNTYLNDARFARYPLWIADWTPRDEPTVPQAWKKVGYRFWQRSSQYKLTEGSSEVDYDIFKGRRTELYR